MTNVVICDDDRVTRAALTAMCEDLGLDVVAETDQWNASLDLVLRFEVDLLILDLSLVDGSGERVLKGLVDLAGAPQVIIFSSYAEDFRRLKQLGASEVIEKPDFNGLALALQRLIAADAAKEAVDKPTSRRVASRDTAPLPQLWRSPSAPRVRPGPHAARSAM